LNMGRLLLEVAAQLMFPGVLSFDFLFHESVEKYEHESEIFLCLELPFDAAVGAKKVALAGDFNAWNTADTLLKKNYKKRVFSATLELEQGREYQFKYLIDDSRWENDWAADSYAPAPVGGTENSVVIV